MRTNKRNNNVLNACLVVLLCICLAAAGFGLMLKPDGSKIKSNAIEGQGTALNPYIIDSLQSFSNLVPYMASPGTVTNQKYFVITQSIDMTGLNPNITRTLANHVIIDGKNLEGQSPVLTNLNSSLFDSVAGPDSVIKNIRFTGNGNIARNFSGILDNVHHVSGWVSNLNATSVGGLVNFSENATIRYCSNAATVSRSTGESSQLVNGGVIGVASGTLYMTNTSNSAEILTMGTVEASGGLIGKVSNINGTTAAIELSFNTGLVNGQCSGGLIGIKEGGGTLLIKESYNTGRVSNREAVTNAPTAGILALATDGDVTIQSCYNRGNVRVGTTTSETTTTQITNSAGIFSTNNGADSVTISKCYNTGNSRYAVYVTGSASVTDCFVLSGSFTNTTGTPTSGVGVSSVTQTVLSSTATITALNPPDTASAVFMQPSGTVNNGYPVLVGLTVTIYTFGANGGSFLIAGEPVYSLRFSQQELASAGAGITFERTCFDFAGFSENAQAQPGDTGIFNNFAAAPRGGAYYVIWKATEYEIRFDNSPDFATTQEYAVIDDSGAQSQNNGKWVFVIGQNIFLQTWLTGSVSTQDYFAGWEIKTGPNDTDFEPFMEGFRPVLPPSTTLEERLNLYENGISIINEAFISIHRIYLEDGAIVLRGLYKPSAAYRLDVDAWTVDGDVTKIPTYRNWGTLKINGNTMRFPRSERFAGLTNFKISVKPNDHYNFVEFQIMEKDISGDMIAVGQPILPGTADENGYYTYTASVDDNCTVYAILEPIAYKVSIVAKTSDDGDIPAGSLDGLLTDNRISPYITVNEVINGITLGSNSEYKLVNVSRNNYKVKNQLTGSYDLRSTNSNGEISIIANSLFLGNYWNNSWEATDATKSIELVAIFVKLEQLKIEIAPLTTDAPLLGTISVFIRDGASQTVRFEVESLDESFGFGSSVTIIINTPHNAILKSVEDTGVDIGTGTQTIKFDLKQPRHFIIVFEPRSFMLDVASVDNNGDRHPIYELPEVSTKIGGIDWDGKGLAAGSVISITKEEETSWADEWRFDGWFLVYGNNEVKKLDGNPAYNFDLVEENSVEIDEGFVSEYLSGNISFVIEARFAKIFNVTVGITLEDSGDAKGALGENLVGLTQCSASQPLKIRLLPAKHYFVASVTVNGVDCTQAVANDVDGPFIIVDVNEELFIDITYEAEQTAVTDMFSQSTGKININKTELGIGSDVVIRFTPKAGFQRTKWTINGVSVADIKSEFEGSNARVSGNTLSFRITADWYDKWGAKLNSDVEVELNTFLVIGIAAIAIIIPVLIIGIIFMVLANKKRKAEYAIALQKMKTAKARMGTADLIKSLKEDK